MSINEKISVEISSLPKLKNPKLICGLPGSGYVGKLAIDYVIDKLQAKQFGDIYSSSFPPQVSIQSDGTVDLVKNSLHYCQINGQDLVLLTGDAQPVSAQGEYALAEEIIELCKKMNVTEIYTLAAYITGKFSKVPKVFGTGTSTKIVNEFTKFGISKMDKGNITGMNGVIIGIAKRSSISGICLLGETSGYVIDAKASKVILESLSKILNIKFDMSELDKRAKDTEEIIKALRSQAAAQGTQDQQVPVPSGSDEKSLGYIS
ncbi:MAG: proteasome assembly chaperone family protein [Nitrosopumilaceae archaeon]